MRAVINILPSEIPDMQHRRGRPIGRRERCRSDKDAMSRRHSRVIIFAAQPATDLGLPNPAVAEYHQLDIRDRHRACAEIPKMSA